jgi:hypothetical protein
MNANSFDAFARRAVATVSRRASLSALGAAALGAIASPDGVEAGCACRKKCDKRCAAQVDYCSTTVASFCDTFSDPSDRAACNANCGPCCDDLRNCGRDVAVSAQCLLGCAP